MRDWKCINPPCPSSISGRTQTFDDWVAQPACPDCGLALVEDFVRVTGGGSTRRWMVRLLLAFLFLVIVGAAALWVAPQGPLVSTRSFAGDVGKQFFGQLRAWPWADEFSIEPDQAAKVPWLKLDPKTGKLTGEPSAKGTFSFVVKAKNRFGTREKELVLTISGKDGIQFVSAGEVRIAVGAPFGFDLVTAPAAVDELTVSGLPEWLARKAGTGTTLMSRLEGTPPATGTFNVALEAKITRADAASSAKSQLTIIVDRDIAPKLAMEASYTRPAGDISIPIDVTPRTADITGTWPRGLEAKKNPDGSWKLVGKLDEAKTYDIAINATNSVGSDRKSVKLVVVEGGDIPLGIATGQNFVGTVNAPLRDLRIAFFGPAANFRATDLPADLGVTLTRDGRLSGTPKREGQFEFRVDAQASGSGTWSPAETVRLRIDPEPPPNRPVADVTGAANRSVKAAKDLLLALGKASDSQRSVDEKRRPRPGETTQEREDRETDLAFWRRQVQTFNDSAIGEIGELASETGVLKSAGGAAAEGALRASRSIPNPEKYVDWLLSVRSDWGNAEALMRQARAAVDRGDFGR